LRQNAPAVLTSASLAAANHESGTVVTYKLDSSNVHLEEGENLLCIQGLNVALNSSDFYFDMGISASLTLLEVSDSLELRSTMRRGSIAILLHWCFRQAPRGTISSIHWMEVIHRRLLRQFKAVQRLQFSVDPESTAGGQKHRSSLYVPPWLRTDSHRRDR